MTLLPTTDGGTGLSTRIVVGIGVDGEIVTSIAVPLLAIAVGVWVYRDAKATGRQELAPLIGFAIGGLFLVGSLPGLVALAVASDPASQGFPTAVRIVPGIIALGIYLYFR